MIDGRKWFASGADGARFVIVMAVTDPNAEPHRRASLLIVPAESPGFRRVRNIACMGHAGDDWVTTAVRLSPRRFGSSGEPRHARRTRSTPAPPEAGRRQAV